MAPPTQNPCSGNCLVHLHSDAGKAWLLRHSRPLQQHLGPDGIPRFLVTIGNNERKFLSAHEIYTSHLLRNIAALEHLYGIRVQNIIAIIPASINPRKYQSQLSAAAAAAGVRIVIFIERSVLAASYYKSINHEQRTVLVFELGDQIFEISLLIEDRGLNVKAADSDSGCPLFNYMVSELPSRFGIGFTFDINYLLRIRTICERAKDALCSGLGSVDVKFERLGREVRIRINREWLVQMNLDHLRSGIIRCLRKAGVRPDAVDKIVLAGASTNIPIVREVLLEFFQRQRLRCYIDPAYVIDFSIRKCMDVFSTTLNIPVVALYCFNLGLYAL